MRKLSIPIATKVIDGNIDEFLTQMKAAKADRVFLHGVNWYNDDDVIEHQAKVNGECKKAFKENGIETGLWLNGFGHGWTPPESMREKLSSYQMLIGWQGDSKNGCFCPLCEKFTKDYLRFVKKIAAFEPDILMIDDDFRLSQRAYEIGCFCPLHIADMQKRLGEEISREELVEKIFSGGPSKYREVYLASMRESLVTFAKKLRETVDEINPDIRLGLCMDFDVWDLNGTDGIELSKIMAGKNKPFFRTNGAPYWQKIGPTWGGFWGDLISVVEYTRMQITWCKGEEIEIMSEGDTFPRPRYTIPSNYLEIFDLMLVADGTDNGILKYMCDYSCSSEYEQGYINRHIRNEKLRADLTRIFEGKKATGVGIFEEMHKVKNADFSGLDGKKYEKVLHSFFSRAQCLIAHNGISTTYDSDKGVVAAFGENARYVPKELLKRGVITDLRGVKILTERGFDTGYIDSRKNTLTSEKFLGKKDIIKIKEVTTYGMTCHKNAEVTSIFLECLPYSMGVESCYENIDSYDGLVASYKYENSEGEKFFVLGYDSYNTSAQVYFPDYMINYNRQEQLIDVIEWMSGKKMDAKSFKNPFLYIHTAKSEDENSMAVGLFNVFEDGIYECEIELDKEYDEINYVNCDGRMEGNKVILSGEIPPYGVAAIEVRKEK